MWPPQLLLAWPSIKRFGEQGGDYLPFIEERQSYRGVEVRTRLLECRGILLEKRFWTI